MAILYEVTSPRQDHGVLVISNNIITACPINFSIKAKDNEGVLQTIDIPSIQYVIITIKRSQKDIQSILTYRYNNIINNTVLLYIDDVDRKLLRSGATYSLGATLYNDSDESIMQLIGNLPIRIREDV